MNSLEIEIRLAVQLSHVFVGLGIAVLTLLIRSSEARQLWQRKRCRRLRESVCSFILQQASIIKQDAKKRALQLQRMQAASAEQQQRVERQVQIKQELPQARHDAEYMTYEAERIPQILEAFHILQEADNVTLLHKLMAKGEASFNSMTSEEMLKKQLAVVANRNIDA